MGLCGVLMTTAGVRWSERRHDGGDVELEGRWRQLDADRHGAAGMDHCLVEEPRRAPEDDLVTGLYHRVESECDGAGGTAGKEHVLGGELDTQFGGERRRRGAARGLVREMVGESVGRGGNAAALQRVDEAWQGSPALKSAIIGKPAGGWTTVSKMAAGVAAAARLAARSPAP